MNTLGKLCLLGLLTFVSTARTQSWEEITGNVPGAISTSNIGPMDTDGSRLYVLGANGVFVSADGGATFTAVNSVASASYTLDQSNLRFVGFANGEVWVGSDPASSAHPQNGGQATLHLLTPGGTTWTKSSGGFPILTIDNNADDIAYDAATGTYYAISPLGGVFVSTDGGNNWTQRNNGQGGIGSPSSVVVNNGVAFTARPTSSVRLSSNQGETWTLAGTPVPIFLNSVGHLVNHNGRIILPFVNGNISYEDGVPVVHQGIIYSDDNGANWSYIRNPAIAGADTQSDGTTLFFGGGYYSATDGITTDVLDQTGVSGAPRRIIRVGSNLFMITSTGLFRRALSTLDLRATTQIAVQPRNAPPLIDGDSHTFMVLAGGENLTYQWKTNGVALPGATSATLTLNPVVAANSATYTVVVTGDYGPPVESSPAVLNVQTPEVGKDDPTFPESPAIRSTALLAVADDHSVIENDANFLQRYGDRGFINSRTFADSRFFFQTMDRAGRLVLVDDWLANPARVVRIDPKTLADDPDFNPFTIDEQGFTAVAELPGRGYLLGTQRNAKIRGVEAPAVILLSYDGSLDTSFNVPVIPGNSNFRGVPSKIVVTEDGKIYVAHSGSSWATSTSTVDSSLGTLVRLNPDGSADTSYTPAVKSTVIFPVSGNRLLAFDFNKPVILNPDGTRDTAFNSADLSFQRVPSAMVEELSGKLVFVGNFTSFGSDTVAGQIRLHPDGTRDTTFFDTQSYGTTSTYYPTDIAYDPRGFLYLSASSTSSSAKYQDSNKRGIIRIFTDRADFGIWRQSGGGDIGRFDRAELSVIAFGPALTYQWHKDGVDIPGANSASYAIPSFLAASNGVYTVTVTSGTNSQTSHAFTLTEVAEPVISSQPASADLLLGGSHGIAVGVRGARPLNFRWRKNGVDIAGATNAVLALGNLQFSDAGAYSVVISNRFGVVSSSVADITVNEETGALVTTFTPLTFDNDVRVALPVHEGSTSDVIVGGRFSSFGGVGHGKFIRLGSNARGVGGAWSDASPGGANGIQLNEIEPLASGKFLIAGDHTSVQGNSQARISRLNADGSFDSAFVGAAFNNNLYAAKELPNGKILVGGDFTTPDNRLVLLNADGSHDSSFNLDANDYVTEFAIQPDGKILVAGRFTTLGGTTANRIARLNTDLTLDTTFNAPAMNAEIRDFGVDSRGGIIIGGGFTTVGTDTRNYLARLHPDGTLDTSFDTGTTFNNWIQGVDIQLNGKIVVGGQSSTSRIARLLPDGRLDPYFKPTSIPSQIVYDVVTTPDGFLYVVGQFTSPKNRVIKYTTDKSDPAVLSGPQSVAVDLGADTTLSVGIYTTSTVTYQWLKNGEVIPNATNATFTITNAVRGDAGDYSVVVNNDTGVATSSRARVAVLAEPVITAEPPSAYTAVTQSGISLSVGVQARAPATYVWKKDGTPLTNGGRVSGADTAMLDISDVQLTDSGYYTLSVTNDLGGVTSRQVLVTVIEPPAGIRSGYNPANYSFTGGEIYQIEPLPGGGMLVAGYFTQVNGMSIARLAKFDAAGNVDTSFAPGINNGVRDVKIDSQGRILVAGDFTAPKLYLARLMPDGSIDTTFNMGGTGPNNRVYTLTALSNGQIFIGGQFSSYNGNSSQGQYGALLNEDGSLDTNFDLNPNHYIWDSAEYPGPAPRILIGSQGTLVDGSHAYLRVVNLDATLLDTFLPSLGGLVYKVLVQPDGKVIAAGNFIQNNGVARFNTDGTLDGSFSLQSNVANQTHALAQQLDGKILVGGSFTTFNNKSAGGFARTLPDGSTDPQFDTGTGFNTGTVRAIHVSETGKIWVGGGFSAYNGTAASELIQLNGDPVLLAILDHPRHTNVELNGTIALSVRATGTTAISYQWYRDNSPIPGATSPTLTISNAAREHSGNYTVVVSNQSGSQTSHAARVIVLAEPIILTQPESGAVAEGSPVTYAVQALGAGELHYQWRHNGTPLGDETNASLTVTTTLAASGCYDVVITNTLGAITSLPAALGVYKAAGTVDSSFAVGAGVNNTVFSTAALPNGNVAIGGFFTSVNGVTRSKFAVVDPQGQVVNLANNYTPPQTVLSLAAQPDGKIILGHNTGNIRLNADGTVDSTFNSPGGYTPAVAVYGGHFYLGGYFGTFDKSLLRYDIATGARDEAFYNNITQTAVQNVTALAFQSDGKILAGENPGTLRRYNTDGTVDNTFAVSGVSITAVYSLAITDDGKIWVGQGSLLYRLNSDGSLDLQVSPQINGVVRSLLARGNDVYAAGDFSVGIDSVFYRTLIRVRGSDGMIDSSFGPVFTAGGSGYTISDVGGGKVVVGGQFTTPASRLARVVIQSDATLAITCQPAGATLDVGQPLHLTVGWTGTSAATYRWTFNDSDIPGATNQTLFIPSIGTTNAGAYKVVVTDASGNVTSDPANVTVNGAGESFANWANSNNLPAGKDAPGDDADGDGVPNFVEFALGTIPTSAASKSLPADRTVTVNNVKYPGVALIRRKGVTGANVEVKAFGSIPFNAEVTTIQEGPVEDLGDGNERVIIRTSQPLDPATIVFFLTRVRQE